MNVAIDTSVLVRSLHHQHPQQPESKAVIETLKKRNETLCVLPQMLYEFWVVATRPTQYNGLGLSIAEAHIELARIKSLFHLFPDTPVILQEWERLIVQHSVAGKNAHDARIVAAMNAHGITHLVTFNKDHFKRFTDITVLLPSEV